MIGCSKVIIIVIVIVIVKRAPDAGAWGPPRPPLRVRGGVLFELSGTHELHILHTIYTKWPRREEGE